MATASRSLCGKYDITRSVTRLARLTPSCAATMPITGSPEISVSRKGVPCRAALLASDVAQPQLGRRTPHLGHVQPAQRTDAVTETKAAPPICGVAGSCSAVNQLSKSVVREIRTLRSEGAGGGRLPPATRWALSNERPLYVADRLANVTHFAEQRGER